MTAGHQTAMDQATVDELRRAVAGHLGDVELFIGWRRGFDQLHAAPYYIRNEADLEHLVWDATCVNNLASLLMHLRGRTVGLIVKGCDSRSVVELLQEGLLDREAVRVVGVPCTGVVDIKKVRRAADIDHASEVAFDNGCIRVTAHGRTHELDLEECLADKCLHCRYPNPLEFDTLVGDPVAPREIPDEDPALARLEAMDLEERIEFWRGQMERCIRCYACRHACPLCICRDFCIADSREPHWLSQETSVREKWMFQMVHALHLAGRCTECGECERACPVGIPILLLKKHLNRVIKDLFDYEAGVDPGATPPLLTFQVEEETIPEGDW